MTDVGERAGVAASAPAPGWYQDPSSADHARWWDGARWTPHAREKPRPAPIAPVSTPRPAPEVQPAPPAPQPTAVLTPTPTRTPAQEAIPSIPVPPWAVPAPGSAAGPGSGLHPLGTAPHAGPTDPSLHPGAAWAPPPSTAWVIAALPLPVYVVSSLVAGTLSVVVDSWIASLSAVGVALGWLVSLLLAIRDRRSLRARGYSRAPSPAWMLLVPPVVYLGIRAARVRAAGGRAIGPVILAAASLVMSWLIFLVAIAFVVYAGVHARDLAGAPTSSAAYDASGTPTAGVTPERDDVAEFMAAAVTKRTGAEVTVDCGYGPLVGASTLQCISIPTSRLSPDHTIRVQVDASLRIGAWRIDDLTPLVAQRSGPSVLQRGSDDDPSMEPIVSTVAVGPIDAEGLADPSVTLTEDQIDAFAVANVHAAGLDWRTEDPDEGAVPVQAPDSGSYTLILQDASGVEWVVQAQVSDDNEVWVWAEVA